MREQGVKLDDNGDVDYSNVSQPKVVESLKKKEQLIKITLMHGDLQFEYPQKLEKMVVKGYIGEWLDQEEQRLRMIASEVIETDPTLTEDQKLLDSEDILTYERYYANVEASNAKIEQPKKQVEPDQADSKGENILGEAKISFDQFVRENASENMFDNDLIEQQYKFWESDLDREIRLRSIWIDLKRKNALGGVDA